MKESEAKKKWCPLVRCAGANSAANRDSQAGHNPHYLCIGSACMMWESWEYQVAGEDDNGPLVTINKGEGDCGLKRIGAEVTNI